MAKITIANVHGDHGVGITPDEVAVTDHQRFLTIDVGGVGVFVDGPNDLRRVIDKLVSEHERIIAARMALATEAVPA